MDLLHSRLRQHQGVATQHVINIQALCRQNVDARQVASRLGEILVHFDAGDDQGVGDAQTLKRRAE